MTALSNPERRIPYALANFDSLPDSANVRLPVVSALFACSDATVWRRVKDLRIPAPRKLSDNVTAWNVGELRYALAKCDPGPQSAAKPTTSTPASSTSVAQPIAKFATRKAASTTRDPR